MPKLRVRDFYGICNRRDKNIPLELVAGDDGLDNIVEGPEVNRPGLGLAGFFDHFAYSRIQIFGKGEHAYINGMFASNKPNHLEAFFGFDVSCCVFTHAADVHPGFIEMADKYKVPVLRTELPTAEFISRIEMFLEDFFAPMQVMSGVLMEVFGVGVLLLGKSGVGKSECALELIERGHRLIADDRVEIKCISGTLLIGKCAAGPISHHMEIRGLGIINVSMLFGVGAIRDKKQIQLVINLEAWDESKEYDRLGIDEVTTSILGVSVPNVVLPISPVRNIPVIIETAAMNQRLKKLGFHAAREFDKKLREIMAEKAKFEKMGVADFMRERRGIE